jgi:hypothetical protein
MCLQQVKKVITAEPVLRLPEFTKPFIWTIDWSKRGLVPLSCQKWMKELRLITRLRLPHGL